MAGLLRMAIGQITASTRPGAARMAWLERQLAAASERRVELLVLPELFTRLVLWQDNSTATTAQPGRASSCKPVQVHCCALEPPCRNTRVP